MSDQISLPAAWVLVELGEIAEIQLGKMLSAKSRTGRGSRPYLRNLNVRWGKVDLSDLLLMDFSPREVEKYQLRQGDVLVCEGGEPGRAAVWRDGRPDVLYQKALHRVRPTQSSFDPQYLVYHLWFDASSGRLAGQFTGSTIKHLPREALLAYPVRLPPLPEQRRIVAAIDEHFTKLAAAVAALERVRANLRRYRASVLQAACSGRLVPTEAELARAERRDYEPADELLQRILKDRRARWEAAELEKMQARGKPPKDDRWKAKYHEPAPPDTSELRELPEGWVWTSVEQVGEVIGGLTKNAARARLPLQLPYLRVANVYANQLRLDDVQQIGVKESEISRVLLRGDDLLVVEGNGSADQIGRVARWDGSIDPCVHQNHLIKVRLTFPEHARFAMIWLLSRTGRDEIMRVASSTSGLYTLSISKVAGLPLPLPPAAEQARIVAEVDRRLSGVEKLEAEVEQALARAGRLRQAILRRAFAGRLVPQDPSDEPASVLLERIRSQRRTQAERRRAGSAS